MDGSEQFEVVLGVAYAMAMGGVIGLERELKNRPAGFRTHMLVAGTAALLVGLGVMLIADPRFQHPKLVTLDPLRTVEAVIAGVAFIGAGTIFATRSGQAVAGITTAASLLMVAVIGVTVGFRYHLLALSITLLTLAVLTVLRLVERLLTARAGRRRD